MAHTALTRVHPLTGGVTDTADENTTSKRLSVSAPYALMWAIGITLLAHAHGALLFVAIISALIVMHEGAHFAAARACGMHASEFAVGFGPVVASVTVGEVRYALRLIPAGGFVKVTGMSVREDVPEHLENRTYRAATTPRKLAVVFAGPVSNLAAGFALAVLALGVANPASDSTLPVKDAAAWTVGIVDASLEGYRQLVTTIDDYPQTIASNGEDGDAARLVSPVGASRLAGQAHDSSAKDLLLLAALFSIALGVFNLLPIIPLDGGHATVAIIEAAGSKIRGRRFLVPHKLQTGIGLAFVGTLLLLSAASVYLDIVAAAPNPFEGTPGS